MQILNYFIYTYLLIGRESYVQISEYPDKHFERKKKFLQLSDSFVALPGGGGTIEEISLKSYLPVS